MKTIRIAAYATVFCATAVYGILVVKGIDAVSDSFAKSGPAVAESEPRAVTADAFESILPPASATSVPRLESFDPTGVYYISPENAPNGFEDASIEISTREYSNENGVFSNSPIVPSGKLYYGKEFSLAKIAV